MAFQSGFAGVFEGWTRLQLIQKILRGLHGPVDTPGADTASDYNRYPKQDIVDKLIEAQVEFVSLTDSLTTFAIVEAVASQSEYLYPRQALKILSAQFYSAITRYEELLILSNRKEMQRVSITFRTDSGGTPEYLYPSYSHGNIRKWGAYPKPTSNGTTFTSTSDFGVVTTGTDFTFTGNLTGTHDGAGNSATLDDSAATFVTNGVTVGMMVFNITDGSSAQITVVTETKITAALAGGTDNDWDVDDSYEVSVGEYGVVIRASGDEEFVFNSDFGAMQDVTPLAGNFLLEFVKRPLNLDTDNQLPEIPMDYQQALVEYAIWKLGGTEYDGFTAEKRSAQGEKEWLKYVERYQTLGELVTEPDNRVEDREGNIFDGRRADPFDGHR